MTGEKKAKKELLIIIPAYNEANNITKLLEKLESPEIAEIADVLIMNDASSDDTNWIVKARNHAIVTHVFNLGYGSALQLAISMRSAVAMNMLFRWTQMASMMCAIYLSSMRN